MQNEAEECYKSSSVLLLRYILNIRESGDGQSDIDHMRAGKSAFELRSLREAEQGISGISGLPGAMLSNVVAKLPSW